MRLGACLLLSAIALFLQIVAFIGDRMKRLASLLLIFLTGVVTIPVLAATSSYSGYTGTASIVNGVPGKVATTSLNNVVNATVLDQVVVATEAGARVAVPVSTTAAVDAAAIAGAASRMVPYVGLALTAAQVASALKDAGFRYGSCANPGLIVGPQTSYCAPVPPNYYWTGYSIQSQFPTADAGCADAASHFGYTVTSTVIDSTGLRAACYAQPAGQSKPVNFAAVSRTNNVIPAPTTYAPATGDDIAGALKLKMIADSNARKAMYDAIKSDLASNPGLQNDSTNPVQQTTPVSVTAPPVTSPVSSPSIQTIQNPDGTTSTQTTTQQTTVTPTTTGTTVGDVKTTFPSTTTTTVTTTNNTTNQTTTSTTVSNNPSPLKLPDDYNREVTQQQVEKDLNTDAAPPMDDQQKVIADAGTKGDADRQKIYDGIQSGQSDKSAWFSWVWSPPVGVCSPITGVIAGFHVEWDLCPTIAIIQAILGWLMAIFSAAEVYGQLFKRGD